MEPVRACLAALALTLAIEEVVRADIQYSVTELSPYATSSQIVSTIVSGINNSGVAVGAVNEQANVNVSNYSTAVMWTAGSTTAIALPSVASVFGDSASSINDAGNIVGNASFPLGSSAFLYSPSSGIIASGISGEYQHINNSNEVVGGVGDGAALWDATGNYHRLPVPAPYSTASGINDNHQAVGGYGYGQGDSTAVLWPGDGTYTILNSLPGYSYANATAINNAGQIVGVAYNPGAGLNVPVIWNSSSAVPTNLGTLAAGQNSIANAINSQGVVVGSSNNHAFVWNSNTGMTDLNNSVNASGNGWTLSSAVGINNAGQIVGNGVDPLGQSSAFLLTPTLVTQSVTRTPASSLTNLPQAGSLDVLNPTTGQFVTASSTPGSLGYIDPTKPTIILTHGFSSSSSMWAGTNGFAENLADIAPTANILAWDWSGGGAAGTLSNPLTLANATYNTKYEGMALGNALVATLGASYQNAIHFYGHSLGTLVNATAVNTFSSMDSSASIQDTLFDEAAIADTATGIIKWQAPPQFSAIPAAGTTTAIDNYISAVGSLHQQAVNIILQQGATALDPLNFHSYPQAWYQGTIENTSASLMGMGAQFNGSQAQASVDPYNFVQGIPGTPAFALSPLSYGDAQALLAARDALETLIAPTILVHALDAAAINGAIQVEGHVQVDIEQVSQTIGGQIESVLTPKITLIKHSPSYAWVPITIPSDAQYMSLNFAFSGLSPADYLTVGIDNTPLFEIESQFLTDGTVNDSGLLDISQWDGQDVELFLGLNASDENNVGGTITIDDIQFESTSVPEPSSLAVLVMTSSVLLLRRRRSGLIPR